MKMSPKEGFLKRRKDAQIDQNSKEFMVTLVVS